MVPIKPLLRVGIVALSGVFLLGSLSGCGNSEAKSESHKKAGSHKRSSILDKIRESSHEESDKGHGAQAPNSTDTNTVSTNTVSRVSARGLVRENVPADFNPDIESPQIDPTAFVDPLSSVIGNIQIGRRVYLAPFSSVRGDEGQPIHIGNESNLQDGVVIHALETIAHRDPVLTNTYRVDGKRYAVYIGDRVSLAHQSHVHGPAYIENDVFVGMQAMVFKAHIGHGSVIEPGAKVIGVSVPPGRYVRAGAVLTDQEIADELPQITETYSFRNINKAVVHVNTSLADGYSGRASQAKTGGHQVKTDSHKATTKTNDHNVKTSDHHAKTDSHAKKSH